MSTVSLHGVYKQFGTKSVLDDVSLELSPGETVGLVGRNGSGKTTLFRIIAGLLPPDMGSVTRSRGVRIGYLSQEPDLNTTGTLHEVVGEAFADLLELERKLETVSHAMADVAAGPALTELMDKYERVNRRFVAAGGHTFEVRLNEILGGLGFNNADHHLPVASLSGGQRCRAALAKLLLRDADLLLLDEPTNHLDIDAVRWLEKFLDGHRGGAVVISHDRYLLDRVCDRIVEAAHRRLTSYPGGYSNYVQAKEIRLLTEQRRFVKDQAFIEKERAFIAKHISGQRTAEAKGRRTRLERRLGAGEFVTGTTRTEKAARFAFEKTTSDSGIVLRCDDLCMRYGEKVLFTDLTMQVHGGQRFGITGPNGTGKTTLLNIVLGKVEPTGGSFSLDPKCSVGYYAQEETDLDPQQTVVEAVREIRPEFSEERARSLLGRFLFTGDESLARIYTLSGGEQSRVRLARLMLSNPDILVLDEPTNHLDIPSREVLEEALLEFGGTLIVVSHDRYFLDRIVDRLLVIRPENHTVFSGNYSDYIAHLERQNSGDAKRSTAVKKASKRKEKKAAKPKRPSSPYDAMSIEQIEELLMEKESDLAALSERFGDPAVCRDRAAAADLQFQVDELRDEITAIDAAWQERADGE